MKTNEDTPIKLKHRRGTIALLGALAALAAFALWTKPAHAYDDRLTANEQMCRGAAGIAIASRYATIKGYTLEPPNRADLKPGLYDLMMHAWSEGQDVRKFQSDEDLANDVALWCFDNTRALLTKGD